MSAFSYKKGFTHKKFRICVMDEKVPRYSLTFCQVLSSYSITKVALSSLSCVYLTHGNLQAIALVPKK